MIREIILPLFLPSTLSSSEAEAASRQLTASLLQWACSGWSGPEPHDCGERFTSQTTVDLGHRSGGGGLQLRVTARDLGSGRGRGLVAVADIAPGETLLSVPLTRVFTSDVGDGMRTGDP